MYYFPVDGEKNRALLFPCPLRIFAIIFLTKEGLGKTKICVGNIQQYSYADHLIILGRAYNKYRCKRSDIW